MKTILIVDDEITLCVLVGRILEYKGYDTLLAHNGHQALRILAENPVDLVLLDVMMPDLTGIDVCHRIRSNPETAGIPVIILTACDHPDTRKNAFKAGADQIQYKPFNMDELAQEIRDLLEPSRPFSVPAQEFQYCN